MFRKRFEPVVPIVAVFALGFVNYVAALTVNAAIVMSVPRSSAINPAPMVLRVKQRLIDGRWHEGEYVRGERSSIVIMPLPKQAQVSRGESVIWPN